MSTAKPPPLSIGLTVAIVALANETPLILARGAGSAPPELPFGPFNPLQHRTFEIGLRAFVAAQVGVSLGYAEQLYTFGDRGRHSRPGDPDPHVVSVGYLALTRPDEAHVLASGGFRPWYDFFPWEDWREGRPALIDQVILPALRDATRQRSAQFAERVNRLFGIGPDLAQDEAALERYELLYEAGLVEEAARDQRDNALSDALRPALGRSMQFDHRRILATAIGRLRAKLKYRPVIFDLMPDSFTLTALQRTVEAIAGRRLHKQNFRRLVFGADIVEDTGLLETSTGGRPAALYRFARRDGEARATSGLRVGWH